MKILQVLLLPMSIISATDISTNCITMTSCTLASNEEFKFNCTADKNIPKLFINGTEIQQSGGSLNQYGVTTNAGLTSIDGSIPARPQQPSLTVYCADDITFSRTVTVNWNTAGVGDGAKENYTSAPSGVPSPTTSPTLNHNIMENKTNDQLSTV